MLECSGGVALGQAIHEYYRQLDMASRSGGDAIPFIRYAMQGFVDGLRDQINLVRDQQLQVAWINFVYGRLRTAGGSSSRLFPFRLNPP